MTLTFREWLSHSLSKTSDQEKPFWNEDQYENLFWIGYCITWIITFIGCWIYAIATYGFLFGVGLGWFPSAIVASIVSFLWPLIILGIILFFIFLR